MLHADLTLSLNDRDSKKTSREITWFVYRTNEQCNWKINNMVGSMNTYYCGNLCWWQNIQCQALSDVSQREQAFLQDLAPQSLQRTPRPTRNGAKQQAQRPLSTTTRFVPLVFEFFLNFFFHYSECKHRGDRENNYARNHACTCMCIYRWCTLLILLVISSRSSINFLIN